MGKSNARSGGASSSSSWCGFFAGSAVTALTILLVQNRLSLYSFFVGLSHKFTEDDKKKELDTKNSSGRAIGITAERLKRSALDLTLKKDDHDRHRELLAGLLKELWPYINIAGCDTIRNTAETMFNKLPGPLSTLHFTKIDLGSVPILLDNVKVHDVDLETNTLQFDLDVVWDGNCDIKLKADYIGSFGVESIKMRGRLSIVLRPLVPTTSIVSAVQYGFINKPEISLKYSGLANVANFRVIDDTIKDTLQSSVNSMMVLPRRQMYKMDNSCDYTKIFKPPLGVARVRVKRGRGFVIEKGVVQDDIPDCYCVLKLGDSIRQTRVIKDSLSPVWDETMDFLCHDHDQELSIDCWDLDNHPLDADDHLGKVTTTPGELLSQGGEVELSLTSNGKPTGAFLTLDYEELGFTSTLDSLVNTNANQLCGLLTIMVLGVFELPKQEVSTFVNITCGNAKFTARAIGDYPAVDCLNHSYGTAFLVELTPDLIKDARVPNVCLDLMSGVDKTLGSIAISHFDLVLAQDHTIAETKSIGTNGAKLQFRICLQGVECFPEREWNNDGDEPFHVLTAEEAVAGLSEEVRRDLVGNDTQRSLRGTSKSALADVVNASNTPGSSDSNNSPGVLSKNVAGGQVDVDDESRPTSVSSNVVRVTAVSGRGFKVVKRFFQPDDVPDIYLNITFGSNPQIWRTSTIKNNAFPVWNESMEFLLHSHGQVINIEVYDQDEGNKQIKDIHVGSVRITAGKIILANGVATEEIIREGKGTGAFITINCQLVDT